MASSELILEASNATHRSLLCHIGHLYNNTSVSASLSLSVSLSLPSSLRPCLPTFDLNPLHWAETKPTKNLTSGS